jgi:zinc protease
MKLFLKGDHKMKKILFLILALSMNIFAQEMDKNTVLLPVEKDQTISVRIMFSAGSRFDPQGKEGLSALTARMLSEGSTSVNSYQKILELLYPLAASYNANPSVEIVTFYGRVHKDNLNEYYPLFRDALVKPAFNEEDFNRIKSNMLNYLTTSLKYSNDEELGKAVLYTEIFKGTDYGHLVEGTISGLNNISLNDVREFYNRYYNRNNFILGIGGGFSNDFVKVIENDLLKLPEGNRIENEPVEVKEINGLEISLIEKQASATAISIGFPIEILRGNKDWYALAVANSWLGEHRNSSSHLYQVIREQRGLNYGDYSYIENFPQGGMRQMPPVNVPRKNQIFEIWIRPVPNETRHFALRAALRELNRLIENGMTAEDFELTRNFLSKYILHYAPSTSEQLGYKMDDLFYGIKGSHLGLYREHLNKLTLQDVNNAVRKYLDDSNMHIAIITQDAESLRNSLINNEASPISYSSPKPESVLKEDAEIINYQLDVKESNINITGVESLFK